MMNKTVTVFLFSEMDEGTGDVTGIQYSLNAYQFDKFLADIDRDKSLIQVGNMIHHSDDIIRIAIA